MKKLKFVLLLLIISSLTMVGTCSSSNKKPSPDTSVENAFSFTSSMKIGWNLGNTLDAHNNGNPWETGWGNPKATQELMNAVAGYGFGAVRIPVTWINNIDPAPDYLIYDVWLNRVAEVVEYVRAAGMKAIINIHHDGADSHYWLSVKNADITGAKKRQIDDQFKAVWTQIAEKFKDSGDFLLFESFNELHDGTWGNGSAAQHRRINELNQIFVETVRAVGGMNSERFLVIPGWVTRPSSTVSSLVMPKDTIPNRIIVSFHYYDPYDFTGSASQNVWGNKAHARGWANETYVQNTFNSVKNKFINNDIPVIIGEYGAVNQSTDSGKAYRKYYMEYVTRYAIECGFVPFYWDNGGAGTGAEKFGLVSRQPPYGLLPDAAPILEVMMKAVKGDYPLSSITVP